MMSISLTLSNASKPTFFLLQHCDGTYVQETWTSAKAPSSVSHCLKHGFLGAPRLWSRGARAGSRATAGSRGKIEVCVPVNQCMAV